MNDDDLQKRIQAALADPRNMGEMPEAVVAAMDEMMGDLAPFKRPARVDEIADVILFLASLLASYVHGANIRVVDDYGHTSHFIWRDPEHILA